MCRSCFVILTVSAALVVRTVLVRADETIVDARRLAEVEAQYDRAECIYRKLIEAADAAQRASIAAELAEMYERLGQIDAAIQMYEQAVAEGDFDKPVMDRLDLRLQRCRRQRASLVQFPVSVEAQGDIRQVEAMIGAAQWPIAFAAITDILERFNGTFRQAAPGHYQGVWGWARDVLDGLPAEGRAAYVEWSRGKWQDTLAEGSIGALAAFIAGHPDRALSATAFLVWADILADQGRLGRALGLIDRREIESTTADERRQRWTRHLDLPETTSPTKQPSAQELIERLEGGAVIALNTSDDSDAVGLAGGDGRLFVYRPFQVDAYEPAGGRWLWRYTPGQPADRQDLRREVFHKPKRPKNKWAGALDPMSIVLSPAGVLIVETYHRGDVEQIHSIVTCLSPVDGRVRWSLGAEPVFERLRVCSKPVYTGGKVVFAANSGGQYAEFWLCAVDADDGQLLWRKRIAAGATPARCVGRGLLYAGRSGPTLVADGEIIYYATHMGAVVAADRDLGDPLWAVSYPSVPRFGPMTTAPLPLLERKSEPIALTPGRLVILPRDINALLVIDRATGELQQTIRSLDLLALIGATEETALVTTLSGQVRAYNLNDGSQRWSWQAPASAGEVADPIKAVHTGDEVIVTHGLEITRLAITSGSVVNQHKSPDALDLRRVEPANLWTAITADQIRVLDTESRQIETPPPPPIMAKIKRPAAEAGWIHDMFMPGREASARLTQAGDSIALIVADRSGLAGYDPLRDYRRLWWRPFDVNRGLWTASVIETDEKGRCVHESAVSVIVTSDDRETINLIDPATGQALAVGSAGRVLPVRALHAARDTAIVVGTSTIAGARKTEDNGIETIWRLDFSPCVFEAVFPGDPITSIFVQPGGGEPGRLLRIASPTGRIDKTFFVTAPLSGKLADDGDDRPERFPVRRLTYHQSQLVRDKDGYGCSTDGETIPLDTIAPIRVLYCTQRHAIAEIADYWGLVELETGSVTLMSPSDVHDKSEADTPDQRILVDWLLENAKHDRIEEIPFSFDEFGVRYERAPRRHPRAGGALARSGHLVDESDRRTGLGFGDPTRIQVADDRILVSIDAGTLMLGRQGEPGPTPATSIGKVVADLFDPPGIEPAAADGLVLDGDLSDWPADGFKSMNAQGHAWPHMDLAAVENRTNQAAFQWAIDENELWLAVRVLDDIHSANSAAVTDRGDRVEIRLPGPRLGDGDEPPLWMPGGMLAIAMALADGIPAAYIRSPERPLMLATPVGMDASFDLWLNHRYTHRPPVAEEVVFAAQRRSQETIYELRIDRRVFAPGEPTGFDISITDDDGAGIVNQMEWGGAVTDPEICPMAPFLLKP